MSNLISNTVKELIFAWSKGIELDAQAYTEDKLAHMTKKDLFQLCKDNEIFVKNKRATRDDLVEAIYGMVNTKLGFKVLKICDIKEETITDFYRRTYDYNYRQA